jgi:hypothetical protein
MENSKIDNMDSLLQNKARDTKIQKCPVLGHDLKTPADEHYHTEWRPGYQKGVEDEARAEKKQSEEDELTGVRGERDVGS